MYGAMLEGMATTDMEWSWTRDELALVGVGGDEVASVDEEWALCDPFLDEAEWALLDQWEQGDVFEGGPEWPDEEWLEYPSA
jgi:hypothetical protein